MKSLVRHQRAYKLVTGWSRAELDSTVELAQGYPIELRTSGTMQTLAFSMGKVGAHTSMAEAIAKWVLSPQSGEPLGAVPDEERNAQRLLQLLAEAKLPQYVAADAEAIAFADAIKTIGKAVKGSS